MGLGSSKTPRAQGLVVLGLLAMAACTAPLPSGPLVLALPPQGKDLVQFQLEDTTCRRYAQQQVEHAASQHVAKESAVGSTAAGAPVGAAASTSGPSAAAGGLLAGSAVSANNEAASGVGLQRRYDFAYAQCMVASGNQVQPPPFAWLYAPYDDPHLANYDPWVDPWGGFGFFGFIEPTHHLHHHQPHAAFGHRFHRG